MQFTRVFKKSKHKFSFGIILSLKSLLLSIILMGFVRSAFSEIFKASPTISNTKFKTPSMPLALPRTVISDEEEIFQKCIDVVGLQAFYPKNNDGSFKALNVLIHSVPFPSNGSVVHSGNQIIQLTKHQISGNNVDAYFYFHLMQVDQVTARVDYTFNYDQSTNSPKGKKVHVELQKINNVWNITLTQIEGI